MSPIRRPNSGAGTGTLAPSQVGITNGSSEGLDTVSLSGEKPPEDQNEDAQARSPRETEKASRELERRGRTAGDQELSEQDLEDIRQLEQRDAEVKKHEQAHIAAGGRYVRGGASFEYTTGPDGRRYAVGGEVSIDFSKANDPHATVQKARAVRRAALAPAQPSGQDRSVAAQAMAMEAAAREQIARESREGDQTESDKKAPESSPEPAPKAAPPMSQAAAVEEENTAGEISRSADEPFKNIAPMSVAASGATAGAASAPGRGATPGGPVSADRIGNNGAELISRSAAVAGAVRTYTQNGLQAKSFPSQNADATRAPKRTPGPEESKSPKVALAPQRTSSASGTAMLDLIA